MTNEKEKLTEKGDKNLAFKEMFESLVQEGEADCQKIISDAKKKAKKIIDEASEEGEEIKQSHFKKTKAILAIEDAKLVSTAQLETKGQIAEAKQALFKQVVDKVEKDMAALRNSPNYEAIFEKLVAEMLPNINKQTVLVSVNEKDKELAEKILNKMEIEFNLDGGLNSSGGLKLSFDKGSVTLSNTFDSRLDKAKNVLKPEIISVLFGDS